MKILVTGMAGFIGYHLSKKLIQAGFNVVGIDNLNNYYEVQLKIDRLQDLGFEYSEQKSKYFIDSASFYNCDLSDTNQISQIFEDENITHVYHLAAQAGVRYSIDHPEKYIESNLVGFHSILENCRKHEIKHFIFSSSSSVYGLNKKMPFRVEDNVDHPISLYAATKKSNELMAHSYAYLYKLPTTGLRFFTVYGPWGRPDMAYFKFVKSILQDKTIDVYNNGEMSRDLTYIDDIVESLYRLLNKAPLGNKNWDPENPDPKTSIAPYQIFNIGNHNPIKLMDFVKNIEEALGKKAKVNFMPIQPGDVESTYADVSSLFNYINFKPQTELKDGIDQFVSWYLSYYKL